MDTFSTTDHAMTQGRAKSGDTDPSAATASANAAPSLSLPKAGGAIRGIGEKFGVNPVDGTGSMSVPIPCSPGRSSFGPQLSLSYDSGAGNGPFGFGWKISAPSITRKTDKGLPRYVDATDSDVFILSGAEDLVPVLRPGTDQAWEDEVDGYRVRRYRPRIEGLFARIERWASIEAPGETHWRSIAKDNIVTVYGLDRNSRIADPLDEGRIFTWLICETRDDKGNVVLYRYKSEDGRRVDLGQTHQRNRGPSDGIGRTANRYLKQVLYGNRTPLLDQEGCRPRFLDSAALEARAVDADWMFEVVFDYGEHDSQAPRPDDSGAWPSRPDAFSSYRSGFEVRTARLCHRVLMFHHFPGETGVGRDCLVRSTDFKYSNETDPTAVRDPVYTFLQAVTQTGYRRRDSGYDKRSLPSVEFQYTQPVVEDALETVDPASLANLPVGLDGSVYRWTDLHGEGISGVLSEQAGSWFYKRNLSPIPDRRPDGSERVAAKLAPIEIVALKPNVPLSRGEFMDLAGDGLPDLVVMDGPVAGLYEHDEGEGWQPFRPFTARLNRDLRDPNLRLLDLDGDGHADVLITENDAFVWHASLGERGFGSARRVAQALDEEKGPRIVFADASQSIYVGDLSGDGLPDIVRIRNGEVCYWPNLGYGRFGSKITMDNAPWFDRPDQFDHQRIRLADIDGSGTADIIYLHRDGVRLYFNQSGNSWSQPHPLKLFPRVDDLVDIVPVDLLGNGTSCLVWSSPSPADVRRPMRYVKLMGAQKPHLLVKSINNLGAETRIGYAPSTKFYLQDKLDGKPWITRLPFPVHVVERVETFDYIGRSRFVTRYAYHHGYFDGVEREFRGFAMVDQWDTEELAAPAGNDLQADNVAAVSHVPPVHIKTWFHTGLYLGRDHVSDHFAGLLNATDRGEYFREPGLSDVEARALLLADTRLPAGLNLEEEREACRALKGSMLRQEVYADDAGADASPEQIARARTPYMVTEQSFTVRALQSRGPNRHAVFFTHTREAISYHYERNATDPRIQHALTLEVDDYGNVLQQAAIGYGRRERIRVADRRGTRLAENPGLAEMQPHDRAKQTTTLLTFTESRVTNAIEALDSHRNPLPCEVVTFELTGYAATGSAGRFQASDLVEPDVCAPGRLRHKFTAPEVAYEAIATGRERRRPIQCVRTLYRRDDLDGLLPLGELQTLALLGQSYRLAITPGLLAQIYQRPRADQGPEGLLPDPASVLGGQAGDRGAYLQGQTLKADGRFPATDADDAWWAPSAAVFFSIDRENDSAAESAQARRHFFLARRYRDPFGQDASVEFDTHDLLMVETRDPLDNRITVNANDYRVLQPRLISDPNRNQTEVAFDILGMVVGTAVMGKPLAAPAQGDTLIGFVPDLLPEQIETLFAAADPRPHAPALLRDATTRIVYDLDCFRRNRLAHPNDPSKWQPARAATLARETHARAPLPPQGLKIQLGFSYSDGFGREVQKKSQAEPGPLTDGGADVNPRWVGSGWTLFNNKGKPVRQYEPFFCATQAFEFGLQTGVSPVLFYDPVERVVATLHPNHTYEKVVFDPWQQITYDLNDTCAPRNAQTGDARTDADIGGYVGEYFKTQPAEWQTWWAERIDGGLGSDERHAALRAQAHADTPTSAHFDSLGRPFLTVVRNRVVCAGHALDGTEESFGVRVELDIQGHQRAVRDERRLPIDHLPTGAVDERIVMRYAYDMLGNRIHQSSMEAGARWMLNDVSGNPIRAWDSRGHDFSTIYDALRRPMERTVHGTVVDGEAASDPRTLNRRIVVDKIEYGDQVANAEALNLRTRIYRHFDSAGVAANARLDGRGDPVEAYDFKGNLLRSTRRLARDHTALPDWSLPAKPQLDTESFEAGTRFDALNRAILSVAPHSCATHIGHPNKINIMQPAYNEANLLERLDIWLERPGEPDAPLDPRVEVPSRVGVDNIDYDAKGQRQRIDYKNGASTFYTHDPLTFRLKRLLTRRDAATFAADDHRVQNLHYTYDAAGNITHIQDDAQQTVYFRNRRVDPSNDYTYDALYRVIQASGREHLGQMNGAPTSSDAFDAFHTSLDQPGDGGAMGRYLERYVYDAVGNLLQMQHRGSDPTHAGWTRAYDYLEASLLDDGGESRPLKSSNRLTRTALNPNGAAPPQVEPYLHDVHGNMVRMPHLGGGRPGPNLHWDYKDQMCRTDLGGGGTAYYVYDATGQRVRKVWEKAPGLIEERIYLGGFEIFRRHTGPIGDKPATLERETLHAMDGQQRIALVETRVSGADGDDRAPRQLIRYQFGNHLGSACVELDDRGLIISYEEYAPYGSSTYQAMRSQTETAKRYRFTGKERDEESGLYLLGARYCASWLGRWVTKDPAGLRDGVCLYAFSRCNPVRFSDPTGFEGEDSLTFTQHGKAGMRSTELTMDIDEPQAVGEKGLPTSQARARALNAGNRQFLDFQTNRYTKHLGTDSRMTSMPLRPPVSVAGNPSALLTRRFSEVTEMQAIFDEAVASIKDPGKYKPTELKNKINGKIWEIIKTGNSAAAKSVRTALDQLGFKNVEGRGYVFRPPPPPASEPAGSTAKPAPEPVAEAAPVEPTATQVSTSEATASTSGAGKAMGTGMKVFGGAALVGAAGTALAQLYEGRTADAAKTVGVTGLVTFVLTKVPALVPLAVMKSTIDSYDADVERHAFAVGDWVEDKTGSTIVGGIASSAAATGESLFNGTFGAVGTGIGQGAAAIYLWATE